MKSNAKESKWVDRKARRRVRASGQGGPNPGPAQRLSPAEAAKVRRWVEDARDGGAKYLERAGEMKIDPASLERQAVRAAFETECLRVFHVPLRLYPDGFAPRTFDESLDAFPRHLFVALRKDVFQSPRVTATAVIFRYPRGETEAAGVIPMVEWVEVSTECRRQGIATELLDGIERYSGWTLDLIDTEPAFEEAVKKARRRRVGHPPRIGRNSKGKNSGGGGSSGPGPGKLPGQE